MDDQERPFAFGFFSYIKMVFLENIPCMSSKCFKYRLMTANETAYSNAVDRLEKETDIFNILIQLREVRLALKKLLSRSQMRLIAAQAKRVSVRDTEEDDVPDDIVEFMETPPIRLHNERAMSDRLVDRGRVSSISSSVSLFSHQNEANVSVSGAEFELGKF